jgi:hypothetical protein
MGTDVSRTSLSTIPPLSYNWALSTELIELGQGKRAWRTLQEQSDFEGYSPDELTKDERLRIERLLRYKSGRDDRGVKSKEDLAPPPSLQTQSDSEIWTILRKDPTVTERAKALEELLRRSNPDLGMFIAEELNKKELLATWRNTLLLATEHTEFVDPARGRVRTQLRTCVVTLNEEWHPRSRLAQEAAIRRYISLLDDKTDLNSLIPFLSTVYPAGIRRIVLLGITNAFTAEPPSPNLQDAIAGLRRELSELSRFFLNRTTLARSEEDFDLGLHALEALLRLGDQVALELVRVAKEVPRRWVRRQLENSCQIARCSWSRVVPLPYPQCLRLVDAALRLLEHDSPGE